MPSPVDIYRTAQLLITQHGPEASLQAAQRADSFNAAGDRVGFHLWRQVLVAVQELEDATIPPGAPRH
jgi:hypothetical protein